MKTLLITLFTMIALSASSQSMRRGYSDSDSKLSTSAGITLGGVTLSVAGFLTPPIYVGTNSTIGNTTYQTQTKEPFYRQGPRFGCIVGGVTVTFTGLISMMVNKH